MTIYLGRSILKYEAFEQLVFDPDLSEHLYLKFYKLLMRINKLFPNREERIEIIDSTGCLFVFGEDEIIFDKNFINK